jgi:hypothetical protein
MTILLAIALAAPAAFAGNNIVKCVDPAGHVTLTDQPCQSGAATVALESNVDGAGVVTVEHYPAPQALPRGSVQARKSLPKQVTLKRDVATLKAARAQLLLMDAGGKAHSQPALAAN